MTGGQWVAHPADVLILSSHITESGRKDSILGIDDFDMYGTQQYYMQRSLE